MIYNLGMAKVKKAERVRNKHFIKEWREHLGLKQEQAAERLGITQSTLSRIEGARTPYDQDFLEIAAQAYGVSISDLITRHPATPLTPIRGEYQILETLNRIEGLDQRGAEVVFSVITTVMHRDPSRQEQSSADSQSESSTSPHKLRT